MSDLGIHPVTPDRRADLLELFGDSGAYSNCWCTWYLLTNKQFNDTAPADRRALLLGQVDDGLEPGLLAYRDGVPVGWCAVAPRERYARMNAPRALSHKAIDDQPAWVVSCFYIDKAHRNTGVAKALLEATVDHARSHGATLLEGFPWDKPMKDDAWGTMFVGNLKMFQGAGFELVEHRGNRAVVRRRV
ncbi:MAG: GNAT family N-acetyltransferase [Acidimicrobiia bacterium]|nr:GNAT family N-acetyltransferase [Acidimicrobiia bacterium]MDH5503119.1 GNAT family N-acetyltransferase [Acidimicrobiia bacterium]